LSSQFYQRHLALSIAFTSTLFTLQTASLPCFADYGRVEDEQTLSSSEREMLDTAAARKYMVELINKDRASLGVPPVELDDTATKAGQAHSDEMAVNGYLSHWALDGKKPDQRYTDAGGRDNDAENVYASSEGSAAEGGEVRQIPLHPSQVFKKYQLAEMESRFFNEKPPYDGHRKNIINPVHTSAGIGLSFASSIGMGSRFACSQEFIDHYGDYSEMPSTLNMGGKFTLTGKLKKGVHLHAVELRVEDAPKPMTLADLSKTHAYGAPEKVAKTLLTDPQQSDDPIKVTTTDGQEEFSANIITDDSWQAGEYYVCLWASAEGHPDDIIISKRTFELKPAK
jgi:uncharacterized protein YkwD